MSLGIVLEPPLRIILLRILVAILLIIAGVALIMLIAQVELVKRFFRRLGRTG